MTFTRASKYRSVKTVVDGITFASKAEAKRYGELKLLIRAGEIHDLRLQPKFPLWAHGRDGDPVRVSDYVADFAYERKGHGVIEDVKGQRTRMYLLKRKWLKAQYGIEIQEVTR